MVGKAKLRTIVSTFAVMVLGLGVSYVPSMIPHNEKDNLVIAGKLGPEPEILMNMYKLHRGKYGYDGDRLN